jgi:hypothetical protein
MLEKSDKIDPNIKLNKKWKKYLQLFLVF